MSSPASGGTSSSSSTSSSSDAPGETDQGLVPEKAPGRRAKAKAKAKSIKNDGKQVQAGRNGDIDLVSDSDMGSDESSWHCISKKQYRIVLFWCYHDLRIFATEYIYIFLRTRKHTNNYYFLYYILDFLLPFQSGTPLNGIHEADMMY